MAHDLFVSSHNPGRGVGRRRSPVLVSFLAHVVVLATIAAVSILTPTLLPSPHKALAYMTVTAIEIPEMPQPRRVEPVQTTALSSNVAPTEAPSGIAPETGLESTDLSSVPVSGGVDGGFAGVSIDDLAAPPAPEPEPRREPYRVGGSIKPPVKTHNVLPVYPRVAQTARVEGTVILEATIDEHGRVKDVRIVRSVALLDDAALVAVRQWLFEPTLLNGTPVPVVMTVTMTFRLNEREDAA